MHVIRFVDCHWVYGQCHTLKKPTCFKLMNYLAGKQLDEFGKLKPNIKELAVETGKIRQYAATNRCRSTSSAALAYMREKGWVDAFVRPEKHKTMLFYMLTPGGVSCLNCAKRNNAI